MDLQEGLVKPVTVTFDLNAIVELFLAESRVVFHLLSVQSYNLLIVAGVLLRSFFADSFKNNI